MRASIAPLNLVLRYSVFRIRLRMVNDCDERSITD